MIRAHKSETGYILMSDDGVIVPLTENEGHAVYLLVAQELERVRRAQEELPDA